MKTGPLTGLVEHLRTTLHRQGNAASDAQLLTRYLLHHEESAFEAIVRRHGSMVLGVCRRILDDNHDAEDAFQATFLVLVRKARTILPRSALAGWLHGVARRTALKARMARTRRMARNQSSGKEPAAPGQESDWLDLQPILDQELAALAGIYRLPIVLCDLEGKSRKEAAEHLGWKEGTLSGRLARGRRLLASRLSQRGVTLSAAALAALLGSQASASPHAALLASTTAVARGITPVTPPVAALTREVLHTMLLQKLRSLSVVLLATLLVMGAAVGISRVLGDEKQEAGQLGAEDRPPPSRERPRAALTGKLYLHEGIDLAVYDLQSKKTAPVSVVDKESRRLYGPEFTRLSPDGRFLAYGQSSGGGMPSKILVADITGRGAPQVVVDMPHNELSSWSWSPDGKRLSFVVWSEKDQKYHPYLVEVATQKVEKVKLPPLKAKGVEGWGTVIHAWSPDNLWLVHSHGHFFLVDAKTQQARQLTEEPNGFLQRSARFSPDGKKVLFIGWAKGDKYSLSVIDLLLGTTTLQAKLDGRWSYSACWAPDSRHIAFCSQEADEKHKPTGPTRVEIYDIQDKKPPQVLIEKERWLTVTDWR